MTSPVPIILQANDRVEKVPVGVQMTPDSYSRLKELAKALDRAQGDILSELVMQVQMPKKK